MQLDNFEESHKKVSYHFARLKIESQLTGHFPLNIVYLKVSVGYLIKGLMNVHELLFKVVTLPRNGYFLR